MATKKKQVSEHASLADAGLEAFTMRELHRSELKNATYNPRTINDKERDKLKGALAKHGLVAPITWNKRTGNIVGGHQRISIMDSLMGKSDYSLSVAVIDVEEAREKELNILLNNSQAQGSWDMDMLKTMFDDEAVTLEGAGFDITDMIQMFGDNSLNDRADDLEELAEKLSKLSDTYSSVRERNASKALNEFFLVFVFPDGDHVDALLEKFKLPDNRYQNGLYLMKMLGVEPPKPDEEASE